MYLGVDGRLQPDCLLGRQLKENHFKYLFNSAAACTQQGFGLRYIGQSVVAFSGQTTARRNLLSRQTTKQSLLQIPFQLRLCMHK